MKLSNLGTDQPFTGVVHFRAPAMETNKHPSVDNVMCFPGLTSDVTHMCVQTNIAHTQPSGVPFDLLMVLTAVGSAVVGGSHRCETMEL